MLSQIVSAMRGVWWGGWRREILVAEGQVWRGVQTFRALGGGDGCVWEGGEEGGATLFRRDHCPLGSDQRGLMSIMLFWCAQPIETLGFAS